MVSRHPTSNPVPEAVESIGRTVLDAAYEVYKALGPGLLESVYVAALVKELRSLGLRVDREVAVPLFYKGETLGVPLRLDLLVGGEVIVEVKSVLEIHPVHQAQLRTYLRLSGKHLGFVLNFNETYFRRGILREVCS